MIKLDLEQNIEVNKKQHFLLSFIFLFFIILPTVAVSSYLFLVTAPAHFPVGKIVDIEKGSSLQKIGEVLEDNGLIHSAKLFYLGKYKYEGASMKAGKYSFDEEMDTWEIFEKIAVGEGIIPDDIKFTIREGEPNYVIAKNIAKVMKNIEEDDFIAAAKKYEGELYPNTYRFNVDSNAETVVKRLRAEFNKQLAKYNINLDEEDKNDILTKASLIESEAGIASYETKRHVAGVIENRLRKGMLLQIDAVFSYINKKHISRVLYRHLEVDSKYNTYKYPGLPPGPISNPSIDSIRAALNPMDTRDLYYITGCDGVFYYATTGAGHNMNVEKYLRDEEYCANN